jgi:hypothetical protein
VRACHSYLRRCARPQRKPTCSLARDHRRAHLRDRHQKPTPRPIGRAEPQCESQGRRRCPRAVASVDSSTRRRTVPRPAVRPPETRAWPGTVDCRSTAAPRTRTAAIPTQSVSASPLHLHGRRSRHRSRRPPRGQPPMSRRSMESTVAPIHARPIRCIKTAGNATPFEMTTEVAVVRTRRQRHAPTSHASSCLIEGNQAADRDHPHPCHQRYPARNARGLSAAPPSYRRRRGMSSQEQAGVQPATGASRIGRKAAVANPIARTAQAGHRIDAKPLT